MDNLTQSNIWFLVLLSFVKLILKINNKFLECQATLNSKTCVLHVNSCFSDYIVQNMIVCFWKQLYSLNTIKHNLLNSSELFSIKFDMQNSIGHNLMDWLWLVWFCVWCQTQANLIYRLSLIGFDFWTFDWLHLF